MEFGDDRNMGANISWNMTRHAARKLRQIFRHAVIARVGRPLIRALMRPVLPLRSRYLPRRFHAYCVGSVKSGTHSIAAMFGVNYRAAHEPESAEFIETILASSQGTLAEFERRQFLIQRDLRLWLELEASHLLGYLLPDVLAAFSDARYILTIRDCYSWLDSYINQLVYRRRDAHWQRFSSWRYPVEQRRYAPEEERLRVLGLCPLDLYLGLWKEHNETVLRLVPVERLLILRTHEIPNSTRQLADFLDIPASSLDMSRSHSYRAEGKLHLLRQMDRDFLDARFQQHCQELMRRFFPDMTFEKWLEEAER